MDLNLIDKILNEEKKKLNISFPHNFVGIEGYPDAFSINLKNNQINLIYKKDNKQFEEEEIRAMMRHELCHILDRIDGKFDFFLMGTYSEQLNLVIDQIFKAYTDYLMAKRFIKLYGLDYFKIQNEIGMEEFLITFKKGLHDSENITWIYVLFKESIKTRFYSKDDERFPIGIWKLVEWLSDDFDYIESLKVGWLVKTYLLAFETCTILENVDLALSIDQSTPKLLSSNGDISFKTYKIAFKSTSTIFTKNLMEKWLKRLGR